MSAFPAGLKSIKYEQARSQIRSGDILIASGDYGFSKLIRFATDSCWSHVAFVMRLDQIDRIMVLESIEGHGVRTIPLSDYVTDFEGTGESYKGRLVIARHNKFLTVTDEQLKIMARFAVDRFAYPYDEDEVARIAGRIIASKIGFGGHDFERNDEYICSEYVYECYQKVSIDVKINSNGFILPDDFSKDPEIQLLFEISGI